jgi:hypothetical protein
MGKAAAEIPADKLDLYEKLVATNPKVERKGATVPYTSRSGHMFSFLDKRGRLGLRLPSEEREAFLTKYKTKLCEQYGTVLKEYVEVPDALLPKTRELKKFFDLSYAYVARSSRSPPPGRAPRRSGEPAPIVENRMRESSRAAYLESVRVVPDRVPDVAAFPFSLPFVADLDLTFRSPVTFLVGENGSGKSTFIEALAALCRLPVAGGGAEDLADNQSAEDASSLARALRPSFKKRPKVGYFFAPSCRRSWRPCSSGGPRIPNSAAIPTRATAAARCTRARTARPSWPSSRAGCRRDSSSSDEPSRRCPRSASSPCWCHMARTGGAGERAVHHRHPLPDPDDLPRRRPRQLR